LKPQPLGGWTQTRRVFIVACHRNTGVCERMKLAFTASDAQWHKKSVLARAFPGYLVNEVDAVAPALSIPGPALPG
jgi:hypothetical protein